MIKTIVNKGFFAVLAAAGLLALTAPEAALATNGHFLHGYGTVNQTMGGAGTGAFLDALGTVNLNPAGSIDLEGGRTDINLEYFVPDRSLASSVAANAMGPGMPPFNMSGSTTSETNAAMMPSFAYVWHRPTDRTAFHFSGVAVGGFGVEYPQDNTFAPTTNAILTPQPPAGMGFGRIESDYRLMKLSIGHSYRTSSSWAVGYSLVPAFAQLKVSPAPFATPDSAGVYPNAWKHSSTTGFGLTLGARKLVNDRLTFGFSVASPIQMGKFRWNVTDSTGAGRLLTFDLDLPAVVSAGIGYKKSPNTTLALDLRWIDYKNTNGFEKQEFAPAGNVKGFGWDSIWVLGMGIQRQMSDGFKLRLGYNYSPTPVPAKDTFFNMPANALIEQRAAIGGTWKVGKKRELNAGYYHAFENGSDGPMWHPTYGPLYGATNIHTKLSEDSFSLGYSIMY